MQSSTHSSQMNTVGPAINLRTSCWLFPQNEQYKVFFESLPADLLNGHSVNYPTGIVCMLDTKDRDTQSPY